MVSLISRHHSIISDCDSVSARTRNASRFISELMQDIMLLRALVDLTQELVLGGHL